MEVEVGVEVVEDVEVDVDEVVPVVDAVVEVVATGTWESDKRSPFGIFATAVTAATIGAL